jgi:AraC family transcriptional regulator
LQALLKPIFLELYSTSENIEQFIAVPDMSSMDLGWNGVIIRYYREPASMKLRVVPSLPDLHIVVILSASLEFEQRTGNEPWTKTSIAMGDVFIIPPHTPTYQMRWENKSFIPVETLQIFLAQGLFSDIAEHELGIDFSSFYFVERDPIKDPFIFQMAVLFKNILATKGLGEKYFAETLAKSIALHILREHAHFEINKKTNHSALPGYRLNKVKQFITDHLTEPIRLEDLATIAGMSVFHFSRLFKAATGLSPNQYVIHEKMNKAKELLLQHNESVAQVAYTLGFENASHFSAQFKKVTGIPPTQFANRK